MNHDHEDEICPDCRRLQQELMENISHIIDALQQIVGDPRAMVTIFIRAREGEERTAVLGNDKDLYAVAKEIEMFAGAKGKATHQSGGVH